jgi:hypothetical protein
MGILPFDKDSALEKIRRLEFIGKDVKITLVKPAIKK